MFRNFMRIFALFVVMQICLAPAFALSYTSSASSGGGVSSVSGTSGQTTSTGGSTPAVGLATTGIAAGSYTNPNVTFDAYGRATAASSGTAAYGTYQPTQYKKFRAAVADVKLGVADTRVACEGDSITSGAGGTSNKRYTTSTPAVLWSLFSQAGIPAAEGLVIPFNLDDRWTAGVDWTQGGAGVGAATSSYGATSGSSLLQFAANHNFNHLDVYFVKGVGRGTTQVNIDGGSIGTINTASAGSGVGTMAKVSFTGIANTTHTISFVAPGGTGAVDIVGIELWDDTIKKVLISNMGINGVTSGGWVTTASSDLIKTYAPSLSIINLGVNDSINNAAGAAIGPYMTNMGTITTYCLLSGDVALTTLVPTDPALNAGVATNESDINSYIRATTASNGWGLYDIASRLVSYAVSSSQFYGDQIHPNDKGYNDLAQGEFDATGKYNGPSGVSSITSSDGSITASPSFGPVNLKLPNSGVTAGTYSSANCTFNAQGICTNATNGSGGSGGGQVFPAINTAAARCVWWIQDYSHGTSSLTVTPKDPSGLGNLFTSNGTVSLGFPQFSNVFTSGSTSGNVAGLSPATVMTYFNQQPQWMYNIYTGSTITNVRYWVGLSNGNEAGNATPAAMGFWIGYDTGVDGTAFWRIITSNGTSTTRTATTVPVTASTNYQFAADDSVPGTITFYINGSSAGSITTNLPSGATSANPQCSVTTLNAAAKVIEFKSGWISSL